jgi:hypothetical protein
MFILCYNKFIAHLFLQTHKTLYKWNIYCHHKTNESQQIVWHKTDDESCNPVSPCMPIHGYYQIMHKNMIVKPQ